MNIEYTKIGDYYIPNLEMNFKGFIKEKLLTISLLIFALITIEIFFPLIG